MTTPTHPTPHDTAWVIGRDLTIIDALTGRPRLCLQDPELIDNGDQRDYEDDVSTFREVVIPERLEQQMPLLEQYLRDEANHEDGANAGYLEEPERQIIDAIRRAATEIQRCRESISLLVAYAREFTTDPPRLVDLAAAADVSKTQIPRLYGDDEVAVLEEYLGVTAPRSARQSLRARRRDDSEQKTPTR